MLTRIHNDRRLFIITAVDEDNERHFIKVTTNFEDAEDALTGWGSVFSAEIATVDLDSFDRKSFKFNTVNEHLMGGYCV